MSKSFKVSEHPRTGELQKRGKVLQSDTKDDISAWIAKEIGASVKIDVSPCQLKG